MGKADRNYMSPETSGWKEINWKKVNHRSYRPIKRRGGYMPLPFWTYALSIPILLFALLLKAKIDWNFVSISIYVVIFALLGWMYWPVVENCLASRLILKVRVILKPEIRFWQKDMLPLEITVRKAFKIKRNGELIRAKNWIGPCRISVPAWFYHSVDDREEFDMLCLSTHKMLGRLEEFLLP
jgi:hypothetical protein